MSKSNPRLRIVQFNLENLFIFMDHYRDQDLKTMAESHWQKLSTSTTPNKSLYKLWNIAASIKEMDADVYCLNEVGGLESLQNFNQYFLGSAYEVYLIEGNSDRGIDVGYLLKKGHPYAAELISHKDRPLNFLYPHESIGPGGAKSRYFSRDVAELRLYTKDKSELELIIFLTHLKSKLDPDNIDVGGKLRREAELKTLVKIYNESRQQFNKVPTLVCGDFNGVATKENLDLEFESLHAETDLTEPLEYYQLPAEKRISQVQVFSGKAYHMHIDYTLVSPELLDKVIPETSGTFRFKNELGNEVAFPETLEERLRLASDHFPMILDLQWK